MVKLSIEDAIELYLKIIAKHENLPFDDCCNTNFLLNRFDKYEENERYLKNVTYDIFYKNAPKNPYSLEQFHLLKLGTINHGKSLIQFQEKIKNIGILSLTDEEIRFFHDYIGGIGFIDKPIYSAQNEFLKFANNILDHFAFSSWNLYFTDSFKVNYSLKEKPGISKSILHFKSYGKAELIKQNPENDNQEILYKGTCRAKGGCLVVELISTQDSKDFLDLMITIPPNSTKELCLGFAINMSAKNSAKKCVIDRAKITSKPFFSCFDVPHKRNKEIPTFVKNYLTETVSMLELSNTIISSKQLETYLNQTAFRNIQIKEVDILTALALISFARLEPSSTNQKFLSTKNINVDEWKTNKENIDDKTIYLSGVPKTNIASIKKRQFCAKDFYDLIGTPVSIDHEFSTAQEINKKERLFIREIQIKSKFADVNIDMSTKAKEYLQKRNEMKQPSPRRFLEWGEIFSNPNRPKYSFPGRKSKCEEKENNSLIA